MTSNAEEPANTPAAATVPPPKATKRATVAPHKRRVAPGKPRSGKKASSPERRPKSQKAANESYRLAGAFCARVREQHDRQEDEVQSRVREERGRRSPLLAEGLIMPASGFDEHKYHYRDDGLAPYSEVVVWRRRFYLALAAVFALLALMLICASRA